MAATCRVRGWKPSIIDEYVGRGLQVVGGYGELVLGEALCGTGIGAPLGVLFIAHGGDNIQAGIRGSETFTAQYVSKNLDTGLNVASVVAGIAKAGASIARGGGAAAKTSSPAAFAKTHEVSARAFARTGNPVALAKTANPAALAKTEGVTAVSLADASVMRSAARSAAANAPRQALMDAWEAGFRGHMAKNHAQLEALRDAGQSTMDIFHKAAAAGDKAAGQSLGSILDP